MIYPQINPYRDSRDLSGVWNFRKDPASQGIKQGWSRGFSGARPIKVPSSWNEQFKDRWDYIGPGWYQKKFNGFKSKENQKVYLRFDSVNYFAEVWLNGVKLGSHEGGHLPFVFEVTKRLKRTNLLVVRAEGSLKPDRVPPGNVPFDPRDAFANSFNPPASFDFFPYCGIQRPVLLFTVPNESIKDITVATDISGTKGKVKVLIETNASPKTSLKISLRGFEWSVTTGG